jgi:predicted PolB exonuclease-like 3'-5' exonuclease
MSEENTNPVANVEDDGTIKVNLDALQKQSADEVPVRNEPEVSEEVQPENVEQPVEEPAREEEKPVEAAEPEVQNAENAEENESVLTEIIDEEVEEAVEAVQEEVADAIEEARETGQPLPENIQKVVDFMNDTGGTLEDYVKLNTDYSSLNEDQLLREYYQSSNPNLDAEDISFLMEDKFSFDEELDDEREVRRKKVERKQELAKAKDHLDSLKSKYYDEIKMGSRLSPDQQKAVEFFNRYNKENEQASKVAQVFNNKTKQLFSDNFEGFDYQVGDKKYRFKVKNVDSVKENQSDINNFIKKFLNEKGEMSDAKGYHKSLFTAMNADQVAKHFYEQGKADAMKDSIERSKNVDMNPRGVHQEVTTSNGWKIRAVDGNTSSSKLKVKFKN